MQERRLRRSDLRPGDRVRNRLTGKIGVVRGNVKGKLLPGTDEYIQIRRLYVRKDVREAGGSRPIWAYAFWLLKNIERVK